MVHQTDAKGRSGIGEGLVMAEEKFSDRDLIRETELSEFVPVVFAKNLTHAEQVKMLLEENEIPTVVEDTGLIETGIPVLARGIPVLVPEWLLNDASGLVASRDSSCIAVSGPLIAYDFPTMLGAAIEGVGLAQVPAPLPAGAIAAGKLVPVLEQFAPMTPGVFLYYPGHRQIMPKLRAFIDHVKSRSGAAS